MGPGRRTSPNLVAFFPPLYKDLPFCRSDGTPPHAFGLPLAITQSESQIQGGKPRSIKGEKHMSHRDIFRAWKDAEFRSSLSDAERAMLPSHPAGSIERADPELDRTVGRASGLRVKSTLKAGSLINCQTR